MFKDSLPHSYNSNTRRAPIENNNLSSEDIYMPVITRTVDVDVSFEMQGQARGNRHEAGWVAKPENAMAAYHPI